MVHKSQEILAEEMERTKKQIVIGGTYSHYKNPKNLYTVLDLAIQEATDKVCVLYKAQYLDGFVFVRDLDNWLEKPVVDGQEVTRFTRIQK